MISFLKRIISLIISLGILYSCDRSSDNKNKHMEIGLWRGVLTVQDNLELPFLFEVSDSQTITIRNAEERIKLDAVIFKEDSIVIQFPIFEAYIAAKFTDSLTLEGSYINESLQRTVPFKAEYGNKDRFEIALKPNYIVTGEWETVFSEHSKEDQYLAKGIFTQEGNLVTGTFRTTTGDYRYLEGVISGDQIQLSTFDGSHAFLFKGQVLDSTINGNFYSGNHWKEPFTARRNSNFELPSADTLTYLKKGYDKFAFSFPDSKGKIISSEDERFRNKVTIVQIVGTWCPNCIDEITYYADFYNKRQYDDLEFVALAFEYASTLEKAIQSIEKVQTKLEVNYPILLAQFGTTNKEKAQEKLPMLNHILSYPTTIFIDKKGSVRKIHTGFNGPATGQQYHDFKKEFESFIDQLIHEDVDVHQNL